ncbi:hypothetical protein HN903_01805 [archaeon]|nr:hypothetical protein [archaeon]MBT6956475.1 hypothetical protein [archaeon]MBT7128468.1 hypothetical protein [archaeon]
MNVAIVLIEAAILAFLTERGITLFQNNITPETKKLRIVQQLYTLDPSEPRKMELRKYTRKLKDYKYTLALLLTIVIITIGITVYAITS